MKKNIQIATLLLFVGLQLVDAQIKHNPTYDQFKVLPSEKVYLSINTSVLLTGEYLFYKFYCLNDKTKQPSDISKIGYVALINENREVVFNHKIRLTKSQGQGDFFIPTSVASGNYKLIAYTRWMKNGAMNLFYQEDLAIINPYQSNQNAILLSSGTENINAEVEYTEDKRFVLTTDQEEYPKKAKVELTVQNFRGASGYGTYNVSVRKKENFAQIGKNTPESYLVWHQKQAKESTLFYKAIQYAPELDGELIKGKLESTTGNASVINKRIGISIPGKDFQLKVVRTDSSGVFHVNISKDYGEPYAVFQILDGDRKAYSVQIEQDAPLEYSDLVFNKFYIDSEMEREIVSRSVRNQIENGFFAQKPDTIRLDKLNDPYGGAFVETVNLEEYTRFKTLDETIVELIPNVWTKKNKEGIDVFKARSFDDTYEESEFDALVYIDGVFITHPNEILGFDTRTVERINTVREKYRLGGKTYFGMVNLETTNGDYFEQLVGDGITKFEMKPVKPLKKYFRQEYSVNSDSRIPDFRDQLFWRPTISFNDKEQRFSFYTSEVSGDYEVVLEGFSIYGRPVVAKKIISVID